MSDLQYGDPPVWGCLVGRHLEQTDAYECDGGRDGERPHIAQEQRQQARTSNQHLEQRRHADRTLDLWRRKHSSCSSVLD